MDDAVVAAHLIPVGEERLAAGLGAQVDAPQLVDRQVARRTARLARVATGASGAEATPGHRVLRIRVEVDVGRVTRASPPGRADEVDAAGGVCDQGVDASRRTVGGRVAGVAVGDGTAVAVAVHCEAATRREQERHVGDLVGIGVAGERLVGPGDGTHDVERGV